MRFIKMAVGGFWIPFLVVGQSDWTMNTTSGRPMREVVHELREQFGWVISYEEGVYDASHTRQDGPNSFVPSGPQMFFSIPAARLVNARSLKNQARVLILNDLLAQHSRQGDLRFRVSSDGAHMMPSIPTPARAPFPRPGDAYESPLDTLVTLKPADVYPNLAAAIQDVITQVSSARGVNIGLGTMPYNVVFGNKMYFDVPKGSTARSALVSILGNVNANPAAFYAPADWLSWDLVYDPSSRGFFFNVVIVPNSAPRIEIDATPLNGGGGRGSTRGQQRR